MAKRNSDTLSDISDASSATKRARTEIFGDASKLLKYTSDVVSVQVGTRIFYIHHDLLVGSSGFLKNALKPEWRKPFLSPINLASKDPTYFEKYFEWLYTRILQAPNNADPKWKYLATMYVMGEEMMDTTFQNVVMDEMVSDMASSKNPTFIPRLDYVKIIYDGTPSSSPARRLMADIFAFNLRSAGCSGAVAANPAYRPFLSDVFLATLKHRDRPSNPMAKPWSNRESYKVTAMTPDFRLSTMSSVTSASTVTANPATSSANVQASPFLGNPMNSNSNGMTPRPVVKMPSSSPVFGSTFKSS